MSSCEAKIEKYCDVLGSGGLFWQLTTVYDQEDWYQALLLTSAAINAIFFLIMWQIKELQVHPMTLFMLITACDCCGMYQYTMSLKTCELGYQNLLLASTF